MNDSPGSGWAPNIALCPTWSTLTSDQQSYAQAFAIQVLWAGTGRRFGLYDTTVRPCYQPQVPTYLTFPAAADYHAAGYSFQSSIWGFWAGPQGAWWAGMGGCGCTGTQGCGCAPPEMVLPGPVDSIVQVIIDGAVQSPAIYRLDGNRLVRQDGLQWPMLQNLGAPAGQPGTWSVEYMVGEPVDVLLNDVAGRYACQIGAALKGGTCLLPQRVQSISRQGVTASLVTEADYLSKGRTGLPEFDQEIAAYNPYGLHSRARVLSPDLPVYR
jgi:hypothetical protein